MVGLLPLTLEHRIAETGCHDHRPLATATTKPVTRIINHLLDKMTEALKGVSNLNVVGSDGLPAEVLKTNHPALAPFFRNTLINVWVAEKVPPAVERCGHQGPSQN